MRGTGATSPSNGPLFSSDVMAGLPRDDWRMRIVAPFASYHFGAVAGTRNEGLGANMGIGLAKGDWYDVKAGVSVGITHGYANHLPSTWQKYTPGGIVPMVTPSLSVDFSASALKQIGIEGVGVKARVLPAKDLPVAISLNMSF